MPALDGIAREREVSLAKYEIGTNEVVRSTHYAISKSVLLFRDGK